MIPFFFIAILGITFVLWMLARVTRNLAQQLLELAQQLLEHIRDDHKAGRR